MKHQIVRSNSLNTIVRNAAIIGSGATFGQIVNILSIPLITRLFSPEAYGVFGLAGALIYTAAPVSTLSLPQAAQLSRNGNEAYRLIKLACYVCVVFSFVVFCLSMVGVYVHGGISFSVGGIFAIVPFGILLAGLSQSNNQYLIRHRRFGTVAKASVLNVIFASVFKVVCGFVFSGGALILVLGTCLGLFVQYLRLQYATNLIANKDTDRVESLHPAQLLRKYSDFPIFQMPSMFIVAMGVHVPLFVFTLIGDLASAGFYALSRAVLVIPVTIVSKSFKQSFYSSACAEHNKGGVVTGLLYRSTCLAALIAIVGTIIVVLYGPRLFAVAFGSTWVVAGEFSRCLVVLVAAQFVGVAARAVSPIFELQKLNLRIDILSVTLATSVFLASVAFEMSPVLSLFIYSSIVAIFHGVMIFNTIMVSKKN